MKNEKLPKNKEEKNKTQAKIASMGEGKKTEGNKERNIKKEKLI